MKTIFAPKCFLLLIATAFLFLIGCEDTVSKSRRPLPEAISESDVAIYTGPGCWEESITALKNMFTWMGYRVALIEAGDIQNGKLKNSRLLCVPGGNMYRYSRILEKRGLDSIRAFIKGGGAYIGICGGAYLAGSEVYWRGRKVEMEALGLFMGRAVGPRDDICPYPQYDLCEVAISGMDRPLVDQLQKSYSMLYIWGPALMPEEEDRATVIGKYKANDLAACLILEYGEGRVFLIGTHPEIEVNGDRDGVIFGEELKDSESDWDLMKSAAGWCLGN